MMAVIYFLPFYYSIQKRPELLMIMKLNKLMLFKKCELKIPLATLKL